MYGAVIYWNFSEILLHGYLWAHSWPEEIGPVPCQTLMILRAIIVWGRGSKGEECNAARDVGHRPGWGCGDVCLCVRVCRWVCVCEGCMLDIFM